MVLSTALAEVLKVSLEDYCGSKGELQVEGGIAGGSINRCYRLRFNAGRYFLKVNSAKACPGMFRAEALGLSRIAATKTIACPRTLAVAEVGGEQFLLMEWLEKGVPTKAAQEKLGQCLAALHRVSHREFGLDHANYMGSLVQVNVPRDAIAEFFVENRLKPQVDMALSNGLLDTNVVNDFEKLYVRFSQLVPDEPPSLVHGDLWSGNYMVATGGIPYIIDPAIAFSHREVDIAMTTLFGGFDPAFYRAYQESFPLQKDWEKRLSLWNLYPLLVHLNLFGSGYLGDIQQALRLWV